MSYWSNFRPNRVSSASGTLTNSKPLMITLASEYTRQRHCPSGISHSRKLCQSGSGRQRRLDSLVDDPFE